MIIFVLSFLSPHWSSLNLHLISLSGCFQCNDISDLLPSPSTHNSFFTTTMWATSLWLTLTRQGDSPLTRAITSQGYGGRLWRFSSSYSCHWCQHHKKLNMKRFISQSFDHSLCKKLTFQILCWKPSRSLFL